MNAIRIVRCLAPSLVLATAVHGAGSCEDVVLEPTVPVEDASFGYAIAFDGERLVVTRSHDLGEPVSAFVYRLDAGAWILEDELSAPGMGATFGRSAAIDGDHVLIGAHLDPAVGSHTGVVYAFRRSGTDWIFDEALTAAQTDLSAYFGHEIDLDGNVAVVGSPFHDPDGRAYAFRYSAVNGWEEEAVFTGQPSEWFGYTVAIEGDLMAVGLVDENGGPGSVRVYRYAGGAWSFEDELTGAGAGPGASFGSALDIDGGRIFAGARDQTAGTIHVFEHDGASWNETATFGNWGSAGESFADELAAHGDVLVVGAANASGPHENSGAVYLYRFDGATWQPDVKLIGSGARDAARYGDEVAVHDGRVIVSSRFFDGVVFDDSGAVWIHDAPTFMGDDCDGDRIDDACAIAAGEEDCNGVPGSCVKTCPSDVNCDGVIGFAELLHVLSNWGPCLPTKARFENEPCGTSANDGCPVDAGDPPLEPLRCGETVIGSTWFDGALGDDDWFALEIVQPTVLTVSASLGGGGFIGMPVVSCNLPAYSEYAFGPPGAPLEFTTGLLDPGTYWIVVGPDIAGPAYTCAHEESAWTLTVTCAPDPPCPGDSNGNGIVDFSDILSVLSQWGPCP